MVIFYTAIENHIIIYQNNLKKIVKIYIYVGELVYFIIYFLNLIKILR